MFKLADKPVPEKVREVSFSVVKASDRLGECYELRAQIEGTEDNVFVLDVRFEGDDLLVRHAGTTSSEAKSVKLFHRKASPFAPEHWSAVGQ